MELIDTQWDVNFYLWHEQTWLRGINRYIVGCKCFISGIIEVRLQRINRYIVGCKCKQAFFNEPTGVRINRYIVGCKCEYNTAFIRKVIELIDTQWDVNYHGHIQEHYSLSELIDTQWDVNLHSQHLLNPSYMN